VKIRALVLPLLAVGLLGCGLVPPEPLRSYVPVEEGLTLQYEDPSQPSKDPFHDRVQVRVAASRRENGVRKLLFTTTTHQGQTQVFYLERDGGLFRPMGDQSTVVLFPEGFPHRVQRWESQAMHFRLMGYAMHTVPGLSLPPDLDRLGVWVEASDASGPIRRTFYLPGIGEAEGYERRQDTWVCVNRLVARGFTDAPALKQ